MYIETELDYRKTGCRLEKKKVERDRVSDVRGKKRKVKQAFLKYVEKGSQKSRIKMKKIQYNIIFLRFKT